MLNTIRTTRGKRPSPYSSSYACRPIQSLRIAEAAAYENYSKTGSNSQGIPCFNVS
jgi:hypothetical protein